MRNLSPYTWRKEIPSEIKTPVLKALMHFPELQTRHIIFSYAKTPFPAVLKAQPRLKTVLRIGDERAYEVKMNREIRLGESTLHLAQLPEAVLVGWIGHELGHITDYEERSNWSTIVKQLKLKLSAAYRQKMGKRADYIAKKHGLIKEIRRAKEFILKRAFISDEEKKKIRAFYPGLRQIMRIVRRKKTMQMKIS